MDFCGSVVDRRGRAEAEWRDRSGVTPGGATRPSRGNAAAAPGETFRSGEAGSIGKQAQSALLRCLLVSVLRSSTINQLPRVGYASFTPLSSSTLRVIATGASSLCLASSGNWPAPDGALCHVERPRSRFKAPPSSSPCTLMIPVSLFEVDGYYGVSPSRRARR